MMALTREQQELIRAEGKWNSELDGLRKCQGCLDLLRGSLVSEGLAEPVCPYNIKAHQSICLLRKTPPPNPLSTPPWHLAHSFYELASPPFLDEDSAEFVAEELSVP